MFLDVAGPGNLIGEGGESLIIIVLLGAFCIGFITSLILFILELSKKKTGNANNKKIIISGICALICASITIYLIIQVNYKGPVSSIQPVNQDWKQE